MSEKTLKKKRYKRELKRLQIELRRLQKWIQVQGHRV
ncbi:MAG: polyphosphate kinase 2, partial [Spirochaetes bacterium]|nr:polyphosphate kinase 2 [Spirochaetota bacterium]